MMKQNTFSLAHAALVLSVTLALLFLHAMVSIKPAMAQSTGSTTTLTYIAGSSVKLEQVIGDCDWQYFDYSAQTGTCKPTTSQTATRYNILGNGQGGSFEDNGKLIFLFGDTISTNPNVVNYHGNEPVGWSTSTDPEAGLLINFFTNSDGTPLLVKPPGLPMGPDDVPNAGISLSDGVYLVCNVGADLTLENPHQNAYSVLVRFDEQAQTFTAGRTISKLPGGHFIFTSLHQLGSDVLMFGAGDYRASDIYLSKTPASSFASGTGTQYFAGFAGGQPTWSNSESAAVPVVQDNPLNGPPWPNDNPTVGNLSVIYSSDLGLWLMTYDGGRQSNAPKGTVIKGTYFTYAQQPWGPWATPQLIFNDNRDQAYGVYVHNPNIVPDPPGDGLNGPVIGTMQGASAYTTSGGTFAPLMIERFTRVVGDTLKIYYNLSTFNPYTIVRMRSEFKINLPLASVSAASYAGSTLASEEITSAFGSNLATTTQSAATLPLPTTLAGTQVTVKDSAGTERLAPLFFVSSNQINYQIPPGTLNGTATVTVTSGSGLISTGTVQIESVSPGLFTFSADGQGVPAALVRRFRNNQELFPSVLAGQLNAQNQWVPLPIDLGPATDTVILEMYGTGLRFRSSLATVTAKIGGTDGQMLYAGLAPGFVGLDQVDVGIPRSLIGRGDVNIVLAVDGKTANTVKVNIK